MKLFLVLCLIGSAVGAPHREQSVRYENDHNGYRFASFGSTCGTTYKQQSVVTNAGQENVPVSTRGGYSWVGPDGVTYTVTYYVAEENDFQPDIDLEGGIGFPSGGGFGGGFGGGVSNLAATLIG